MQFCGLPITKKNPRGKMTWDSIRKRTVSWGLLLQVLLPCKVCGKLWLTLCVAYSTTWNKPPIIGFTLLYFCKIDVQKNAWLHEDFFNVGMCGLPIYYMWYFVAYPKYKSYFDISASNHGKILPSNGNLGKWVKILGNACWRNIWSCLRLFVAYLVR